MTDVMFAADLINSLTVTSDERDSLHNCRLDCVRFNVPLDTV